MWRTGAYPRGQSKSIEFLNPWRCTRGWWLFKFRISPPNVLPGTIAAISALGFLVSSFVFNLNLLTVGGSFVNSICFACGRRPRWRRAPMKTDSFGQLEPVRLRVDCVCWIAVWCDSRSWVSSMRITLLTGEGYKWARLVLLGVFRLGQLISLISTIQLFWIWRPCIRTIDSIVDIMTSI